MKILIAIPCMDHIPVGFVQSISNLLVESAKKRTGNEISVYFKPNSLVYDSRNLISLYAIENKFDAILWLDSDMMFKPDTLDVMLNDMRDLRAEMITGVYVKRYFPTAPVLYKEIGEPIRKPDGTLERDIQTYDNYPKDTVFTVAGCGFGCVLTTVSLLKELWDKFGPPFAPFVWASEDISFCYRVGKLNKLIYCDSNIHLGHIGTFVYTETLLNRGEENGKG